VAERSKGKRIRFPVAADTDAFLQLNMPDGDAPRDRSDRGLQWILLSDLLLPGLSVVRFSR
jgi:hypothetical protein